MSTGCMGQIYNVTMTLSVTTLVWTLHLSFSIFMEGPVYHSAKKKNLHVILFKKTVPTKIRTILVFYKKRLYLVSVCEMQLRKSLH